MKHVFVLTALIFAFFAQPALAETDFVQRVIDARTLQLISGETVRLIGVDLPENATSEELKKAADHVRSMVSGNLIELEYDVEKRDAEGNLLAYVWFIYPSDASTDFTHFPEKFKVSYKVNGEEYDALFLFLNATLIKAGVAVPSQPTANNKHTELFAQLHASHGSDTAETQVLPPSEEMLVSQK